MGTARGFATFGFFFSMYECVLTKLRYKDDSIT
jgi:hypothetical protein